MILKHLTNDDRSAWEKLVRGTAESGFMQSWAWSEFKEAEGQKVIRIGIFDKGDLIGGGIVYYVPSSLGSSPLELPHGPVLPWKDEKRASACMSILKKELSSIAKKLASPLARLEPFTTPPLPAYMGKLVRAPIDLIPTPTLIISIRSDEKMLLSMTPKGRYNVRLALKKGVEVRHSEKEEAVEDFYELFELTFSRHDFSGEGRGFFKNMMRFLGPCGMARIYSASYKGIVLSSAVSIYYGERATYLYGGNLPFFTSAMASYALHWRMMTDGRESGCSFYDMYGIAPAGQPFHPYAKFSQFKSRFGGAVVATAGAHDVYFYPQLADMWVKSMELAEKKLEFSSVE
jgi:peptidoglycan pentaglycine glycine transferase (the first glycine)